MTKFDEREKSFEKKFVKDEELQFKIKSKRNKYLIIIYFFMISIILEGLHLVIPNRGFQFSDLFGNIVGVLLSLLLINLFNFWRKK